MRKIFLPFAIIALVVLLSALFYNSKASNISGYLLYAPDDDIIEKNSPYDRIKEGQIKVYDSLIIMHIENSELARLENTNSMDPLIDEESNVIQIKPDSEEDVHIGDLISYDNGRNTILHRVVEIGEDKQGKFFVLKGDNVNSTDPAKVRFSQIRGVVAVVY